MAVRIVNLRKYIELTKPEFTESDIYEVLSNLVHGRKIATLSDGKTQLDESVKVNGMTEIQKYLGMNSYDDIIESVSSEKLLATLATANNYEKTVTARLLFERYNGLLSKLKKKYPAACKFVNETNHIENDYIFQLNPFEFFQIPEFYLSEIETFLEDERETIIRGFNKEN